MELPQLKEIAAAKGIELPLRTRMATYISHILGEAEDGVTVEVTEPPVTTTQVPDEMSPNGDIDLDALAIEVANLVIDKLVTALKS